MKKQRRLSAPRLIKDSKPLSFQLETGETATITDTFCHLLSQPWRLENGFVVNKDGFRLIDQVLLELGCIDDAYLKSEIKLFVFHVDCDHLNCQAHNLDCISDIAQFNAHMRRIVYCPDTDKYYLRMKIDKHNFMIDIISDSTKVLETYENGYHRIIEREKKNGILSPSYAG